MWGILIPSSLSPFKISRALLPSGIKRSPWTRTPSMSKANAIFFAAEVLTDDISWTCEDMISRLAWTGGMPGLTRPSPRVTEERRDWRFDLGMGSETPKLFLEPRREA